MTHGVEQIRPAAAGAAKVQPSERLSLALQRFADAPGERDRSAPLIGVTDVLDTFAAVTGGPRFVSVSARNSQRCAGTTLGYSDAIASRADAQQFALGEGPGLAALAGEIVTADAATLTTRWPRFAAWATSSSPFRSVMSWPLPRAGRRQAAITFYMEENKTPPEMSVWPARAAAALAALTVTVLDERERSEDLSAALASSRQIGAAIGVLMAGKNWTYEQAFDALCRFSQTMGVKVHAIADEVVWTGALPNKPDDRSSAVNATSDSR